MKKLKSVLVGMLVVLSISAMVSCGGVSYPEPNYDTNLIDTVMIKHVITNVDEVRTGIDYIYNDAYIVVYDSLTVINTVGLDEFDINSGYVYSEYYRLKGQMRIGKYYYRVGEDNIILYTEEWDVER